MTVEQQTNDATPERLAHSIENHIGDDGARHFTDELLIRMANKGQLYPDADINRACLEAGERYYADWYGSNMSTLQAIDYGKVSGGGGGSGSSMPVSQMQAIKRASYRAARHYLGKKYREALELILLQGQTDLVAVGKSISGAVSPHTCRSVAIERFTAGLFLLMKHYGS
jgi:hypothetical protein